jgi:hypothetical protein
MDGSTTKQQGDEREDKLTGASSISVWTRGRMAGDGSDEVPANKRRVRSSRKTSLRKKGAWR